MTIKQLKTILNKFDETLEVLVDGYEGGCHSLKKGNIQIIKFDKNINKKWYYGEHEESKNGKFKGLLMGR